MTAATYEYQVEPEVSLGGAPLARVRYRRAGSRRWARFLVVIEGETTYEVVARHVLELIREHEGRAR